MEINLIPGTCSMAAIRNNPARGITSKQTFKRALNNFVYGTQGGDKVKRILLNTNSKIFSSERRYLRSLGFRRIYSYKGNAGRVTVMMLKIK